MKIFEGNHNFNKLKIALVCSKCDYEINHKLITNAEKQLLELGINEDDISLFKIPGILEMPRITEKIAESNNFSAVICLGTLLDNSASFGFKGLEITRELLHINMKSKTPIVNGIIMGEEASEIETLVDKHGSNSGAKAVLAAIEIVSLEKII